MAVATKGADIAPASAGRHIAQLQTVEETAIKSQFPTNPDGTADVFIWKFKSRTENEETGEREQIRHMTNAVLTPNNNQMKFWKQLVPGITYEECTGDTEEVEGKWFEIEVTHEKKGDKTYANIAFLKPYVKPETAGKKAAPVVTEADDPFAND
jgi:hypothetical protein